MIGGEIGTRLEGSEVEVSMGVGVGSGVGVLKRLNIPLKPGVDPDLNSEPDAILCAKSGNWESGETGRLKGIGN